MANHRPETVELLNGETAEVCGECSTPDTGDWGTADVAYSEPWPCKASRKEKLTVVADEADQ